MSSRLPKQADRGLHLTHTFNCVTLKQGKLLFLREVNFGFYTLKEELRIYR